MADIAKNAKKGVKKGGKQDELGAESELVFGGANEIDDMKMVNFGDGDNLGEEFGEKQREPNIIHLHYQQRTARKCLTIIQGLPDDLDFKKILRAYKKLFNCNGTIVEDEEMGTVI